MFRQVPGLPHAATGTARKVKKNKSVIDGQIMDPIARHAAQHCQGTYHRYYTLFTVYILISFCFAYILIFYCLATTLL